MFGKGKKDEKIASAKGEFNMPLPEFYDTILKMRSRRADCERAILDAIGDFETATGLLVKAVTFSTYNAVPSPTRSDTKAPLGKINSITVETIVP